jgi:hypothetical protein
MNRETVLVIRQTVASQAGRSLIRYPTMTGHIVATTGGMTMPKIQLPR